MSLGRVAPPRTRPETAAYRPDPSLESFLLPRGKADRSLLDAALAEAKGVQLDDQMVLKCGRGPERVRLLDHPEYPSCVRYASALCYDGELALLPLRTLRTLTLTLTLTLTRQARHLRRRRVPGARVRGDAADERRALSTRCRRVAPRMAMAVARESGVPS